MQPIAEMAGSLLNYELLRVGEQTFTLGTLLAVVVVLSLTFASSHWVQSGVGHAFRRRGIEDEGTIGVVGNLAHYVALIVGFFLTLRVAGIDLGGLFAAGALFAVALGFAMQNMSQNFVAGVGLLAERSIKPGDVLEVEGLVVKVLQMGIRATIVKSRDGEALIVPNGVLMQSAVKNFTLRDSDYRVRTTVGVTYGSDMALVRETLETVSSGMSWKLPKEPQVILTEFGDNSVNWEVAVWCRDPWNARVARSELNEAIWWALQEKGIVIAFPQLDVHFDPDVVRRLGALRPVS